MKKNKVTGGVYINHNFKIKLVVPKKDIHILKWPQKTNNGV